MIYSISLTLFSDSTAVNPQENLFEGGEQKLLKLLCKQASWNPQPVQKVEEKYENIDNFNTSMEWWC